MRSELIVVRQLVIVSCLTDIFRISLQAVCGLTMLLLLLLMFIFQTLCIVFLRWETADYKDKWNSVNRNPMAQLQLLKAQTFLTRRSLNEKDIYVTSSWYTKAREKKEKTTKFILSSSSFLLFSYLTLRHFLC